MANRKSGHKPVEKAQGLLADLFQTARNLTYASVGIVGAVGEEAEEVYRRSIKRGQRRVRRLEQRLPLPERFKRASAETDQAGSETAAAARRVSEAAAEEWQAVLDRLNLARPQDVETLTKKLADLEAKLDALAKEA